MNEWFENRWLRLHATIAPFGILATAWLLCYWASGQWQCWERLEQTAALVDLGAVVYAAVAVLVESGGRTVFWAYEQWKKDRAKRLAEEERRQEMWRAEGRDEVKAQISAQLLEASQQGQTPEAALERIAAELDIDVEGLASSPK